MHPYHRPLPDAVLQQLEALIMRCGQLLDMLTAEGNRVEAAARPPGLGPVVRRTLLAGSPSAASAGGARPTRRKPALRAFHRRLLDGGKP